MGRGNRAKTSKKGVSSVGEAIANDPKVGNKYKGGNAPAQPIDSRAPLRSSLLFTAIPFIVVVVAITARTQWAAPKKEPQEILVNVKQSDGENQDKAQITNIEYDLGVDQEIGGPPEEYRGIMMVLDETRRYMEELLKRPEYDKVKDQCRNRHGLCAFWASMGQCEEKFEYMLKHCAPSCRMCELIDDTVRCAVPSDIRTRDSIQPFEFNQKFEALAKMPRATVHSSPKSDGPWIITIDGFVTDDECDRLIQHGHDLGYKQSLGQVIGQADEKRKGYVADDRTSSNTWCQADCDMDASTQSVRARIETVLGIPSTNQEYLQLLRYEETQRYAIHHDFIDGDEGLGSLAGPRIATFLLYLNNVEEGGETVFNRLNMTVLPKKRRALLWPNVMLDNLDAKDFRTEHEARPVQRGVKYAANAWVHLRDFMSPSSRLCS